MKDANTEILPQELDTLVRRKKYLETQPKVAQCLGSETSETETGRVSWPGLLQGSTLTRMGSVVP